MTTSKYSKSNSIRSAASELNKEIHELTAEALNLLYKAISNRYTGDLRYPLWERINGLFVRDEQGWLSMRSLIPGQETILFLDSRGDKFAIKVQDGNDLVEILDACGYITFYITNPSFDFLLAFNDHDVLMVKGEKAETWMKATFAGPWER